MRRAALVGVSILLSACATSTNPDPRALPKADPRFGLHKSLDFADVVLPPSAAKVRFGYYVSLQGEGLNLRFAFACKDLPIFLSKSGVPSSVLKPHVIPPMVGTAIGDYKWSVDERKVRGGQQDWFSDEGGGARDFAVEQLGNRGCVGYVATGR